MDPGLKQRLVGAAVLVALAVIFLPMLVQGPAPDSGVSDVPLTMPDAPRGDYETRDLPLVTPGGAPAGGALGMAGAAPVNAVPAAASALPAPATMAKASDPAELAAVAGGDYAVSFGAYANEAAADAVIASLRTARLPGYREATTSGGKPAWRVRIGPFATRADAEAARLRAAHVRDDVGAQVVVLDAVVAPAVAAAPSKPDDAPEPAEPARPSEVAKAPATARPDVPKPAPKPVTTSPAAAGTGFAVQLAAFSKPGDAAALRDRVRAAGFSAFTESVATDKGTLTRVRVGPVVTRAEAEQLQAQVKAKVGVDGLVRPHP